MTEEICDTGLMDCVPQAVIDTFKATCSTSMELCDGSLEDAEENMLLSRLSLVGDVSWTLLLGFPQETAAQAVSDFVGFEIDYDSEDMDDAIGEFANITAGQIKVLLDRKSTNVELGLPTVIRGKDLQVIAQKHDTLTMHCFDSIIGRMWAGIISKKD